MPKTENQRFYGLIAIIFIFLCSAFSIRAATFTVTKIADTNDGLCNADCSLREAIAAANAAATDDVIEFSAAVFGTAQTITLSGPQLEINNNGSVTINGTGSNLLTVSGNDASRVFVFQGAIATVNSLKITNGKVIGNGGGGGIYNSGGILTLNNSVVANNASGTGTFSGEGGGIYNCGGNVTVNNSTFSSNTSGNNGGGGIASGDTCVSGRPHSLTVTGSTFINNTSAGNGGAILANNLTISNTAFSNNSASNGGAVIGGSNTNLTNVTFTNNTATVGSGGAFAGGGPFGIVTLSSVTMTNNTAGTWGGAMSIGEDSRIIINDSSFSGNSAVLRGGAFYNFRGTINLNNSTVNNNQSADGGAIYNDSLGKTVTISFSTLRDNTASKNGGAIIHTSGTLTINNSTLNNNTAGSGGEGGGAIYNEISTINVTNSTISNNLTNKQGGGIFNRGTVNLANTTIAFNQSVNGGGVLNFSDRIVNARNTIIARNTAIGGINPDFSGRLSSQGYNLIENLSGTTITGVNVGNILGTDAQLSALRNNGGMTATIALLPTSPAIDSGDPNIFAAIDQRGVARPEDGDFNGSFVSDIGAYERQPTFYSVTKAADTADGVCDSDCSLREAVSATNIAATPDNVILFDQQVFNAGTTISLNGTELNVTGSGTLVIYWTGAEMLSINGGNLSRVFYIGLNSKVLLSRLRLTGGVGSNWGGGLINEGTLAISDSAIDGNRSSFLGGGIYNRGAASSLILLNSSVSNNRVTDNDGGGITNDGNLTVVNSTINGNIAGRYGGGIITRGGTVTVSGSTISGNRALEGGGFTGGTATVTFIDSTVSGNTASSLGGGIDYNFGTVNLINTTVSLNTVTSGLGGGIYAEGGGTINLTNATITKNSSPSGFGGGIFNSTSTVNAKNTIIAQNTASSGGTDFRGTLASQGYNLIGALNQTTVTGNTTGNITGIDPLLGTLSNNGGLTQTHTLLPGSPAIDAADPANFPTADQRGVVRPKDGDRNGSLLPDIGAFERDITIDNSAPFDFDGDGRTDISIFRPSDGSWWYSQSSDNAFRVYAFGTGADVITPGDYTGDGTADLGIFRSSTGEWFIQRSEDNSYFSFPFGTNGDIPAPADYDNDGKTDAAVFRPSTGTWYIQNSNGSGTSIVNFGTAEDKPVPADFDGDGKSDIAIFRPSDGSWWYLRSSDSQFRVFSFGLGTDKPVQGDWTGDGKADLAIFREATGEWFFQRSEDNSYYSVPFGAAGDIPTPGDYDGDGKFDTAVFRPSTANWFVNRSTAGILITNFGTNGDRPVPNAFVP